MHFKLNRAKIGALNLQKERSCWSSQTIYDVVFEFTIMTKVNHNRRTEEVVEQSGNLRGSGAIRVWSSS